MRSLPPSVTGPLTAARWAIGGLQRRLSYREEPGDDVGWSTTERVIALTYDDGPEPVHQPALLRTLASHGAPATFFVLGEQVTRNPGAFRDLIAAGHEVAAHGFTHADVSQHDLSAATREMSACLAAITTEAHGVVCKWYRPPYGRMAYPARLAAHGLGMGAIRWTVDPQDWRHTATASGVADYVVSRLAPGAVVLLHSGMPATPEATYHILEACKREGYRCVTVSEMAALSSPSRLS